jgi:putative Mg2+ transporter-C (MgtC) family protein
MLTQIETTLAAFIETPLAHTAAVIVVAFTLGLAIGFERQWRQRTAGLRTNVLVAVGAAAFSDLGMRLYGADGATRIIAYVVSGIGFLGAGVIVKDGTNIRGLNTAATLWCSGAVGAFTGAGLFPDAAMLTVAILAGNTVLRPLANWMNRRPIDHSVTEAEYRVHVFCAHESLSDVRDLMESVLNDAHFPIRRVETLSSNRDTVEIAAVIVPTTVEDEELDSAVATLEASALVQSSTWSVVSPP